MITTNLRLPPGLPRPNYRLAPVVLAFLVVSGAPISARAAVDCTNPAVICKSGTISVSESWSTPAPTVYVVTGNVTVAGTATLTIGPGVIVKFLVECCTSYGFTVAGTLNVNGATGSKVYLTSSRDDTIGGDTNGDGGATAPASRDWAGIGFNPGSAGSLINLELRYSDGAAIYLDGSAPTLNQVTVKNAYRAAVSARITDKPVITGLTSTGTPRGGLEIRGGTLSSTLTWDLTGVAYIVSGNVTIATGATLTIGPGVIVKFLVEYPYYGFTVAGTLNVNGTTGSKVYFTSSRDDTIGGDTNGDGANTSPAASDWDGINFSAGSTGTLSFAEVRYADDGLDVAAGNVTARNCTFTSNTWGIYNHGATSPRVNRSNLVNNADYAVYVMSGSGVVDARWNWWGTTAGPSTSGVNRVTAGVSYTPWSSAFILNSISTTTTLGSGPNPSSLGQTVTLTAVVTAASGSPTGLVFFEEGATVLGTGTLGSGVSTLSLATLAQGSHSLKAEYGGDANFDGSASIGGTHTVNAAPAVTVSIGDVTLAEGNSGNTAAGFVVTLSAASAQAISVAYGTADVTATAGSDYQAMSGTLSFVAGETSKTINVTVFGDTVPESDETFTLSLSNPTNATLANAQGTGTIVNDDGPGVGPFVSIDDRSVAEGAAINAAFRLSLSVASSLTVSVDYATSDGAAKAGTDYVAQSGRVTFSPGRTTHSILVAIFTDSVTEGIENFFVNLSNPVNASIGDGQALGTITDPPSPAHVAMYRSYSKTTDYHFFTTDKASKDFAVGVLGFQDESNPLPFYVSNVLLSGTVPLFRMYNPNLGRHFYTASAGSRDFLMGIGYVYEKEEGFVYPLGSAQPAGATELLMLYNNNSGTHLFTADPTQKDGILNLFKGVWVQHTSVGFVFTSP